MKGLIQFNNLGRRKFNGQVEVKSENQFWDAVKKHLMSSDLEYTYDPETNHGSIIAGFREVGTFKVLEASK